MKYYLKHKGELDKQAKEITREQAIERLSKAHQNAEDVLNSFDADTGWNPANFYESILVVN